MAEVKIQKPFLKWVGGKTQILKNILEKIPKEMDNYHELFLGGGSVLLAVLSMCKNNKITIKNKIYAYDINEKFNSCVYKDIQNNKDNHKLTKYYFEQYDNITGTEVNRKPKCIEEAKTSKESILLD